MVQPAGPFSFWFQKAFREQLSVYPETNSGLSIFFVCLGQVKNCWSAKWRFVGFRGKQEKTCSRSLSPRDNKNAGPAETTARMYRGATSSHGCGFFCC